jgi:CorA-like Mg2+ transporter protein
MSIRTVLERSYPKGGDASFSSETTRSRGTSGDQALADPEIGQSELLGASQSLNSAFLVSRRRHQAKRTFVPQWLEQRLTGSRKARTEPKEIKSTLPSEPLIEQIGSRMDFNFGLEDALQSPSLLNRLQNQLLETKSTLGNFNDYLDNGENYRGVPFGILNPLFGIIRKDLLEFMKLLHNILDKIGSEILDDMTMEDRLTIWRQIITRAELELPEIRRSMVEFFAFLRPPGHHSAAPGQNTEDEFLNKYLQECLASIEGTIQRLKAVSMSLTSNMALLDSRRSIAEAQNVTRLTELAFLFIPLTFAATLLGMQIDQFENRVPLSTFVILGVSFTGFSYGVRLAIRSSWLRSIVEMLKESVRIYADSQQQPVQRGYVPTSLFLRWIGNLSWSWAKSRIKGIFLSICAVLLFLRKSLILLMLIGFIYVLPLALLWTRELDYEIQVFFTVAFLSFVSMVVFIVVWWFAGSVVREALRGLLKKEYEKIRNGRSRIFSLLLWVGSACIFLVPIVVLWKGHIAYSVKVVFTIALIILIVGALIFYGIYKLFGDDEGVVEGNGQK